MSQIIACNTDSAPSRVSSVSTVVPAVNIRQDAEGYTLEAEMPGVAREGVEVTFADGKLTLVGRRPSVVADSAIYRETVDADYRRAFDLDPAIDATRIEAGIEQGLLTVRLPKSENAKPRRIVVS